MSTDYAEKERDFIASLPEDTGRDLSAWMLAISESGHRERNAIIDWLRHQGFQFSQASWLERIHHNGGRLIYGDDDSASGARPISETPFRREVAASEMLPPAVEIPASGPQAARAGVQRLIGEAKGLKPLADLVLHEIARAAPGVQFAAVGPLIFMLRPQPFAALLPAPRKLRLYGTFGPAGVRRAHPAEAVNKSAPPFPEMLVLDDARDIDEEFQRLIRAAARL
jgi:hypothetical protein